MYRTDEKCKNCGGEYGIHQSITKKCPFGGREAPFDKKQVWMECKFEPGITYELLSLKYEQLKQQHDTLLEVCKEALKFFIALDIQQKTISRISLRLSEAIANVEKQG